MKFYIMAAGEGERMGGQIKSLIQIDGQTLLSRQIEQFKCRVTELIIVSHHPELRNHGIPVFIPASHRWKLDTLVSTADHWDKRATAFIHGDVWFSDEAVDAVVSVALFSKDSKTTFFWDGQEVFAMVVPGPERKKVRSMAKQLVQITEPNPLAKDNECGFAGLLSALHAIGRAQQIMIDDWTQDFDTPQEVEGWAKGWRKNKLYST